MNPTEILTAAGIAHHRRGRFVKPPGGTYAVWSDDVTTDGPDGMAPGIFFHDIELELYEPQLDDAARESLEAQLSTAGLHWTRQDRFWIQSEKMYQTIYTYSYIEKRRI